MKREFDRLLQHKLSLFGVVFMLINAHELWTKLDQMLRIKNGTLFRLSPPDWLYAISFMLYLTGLFFGFQLIRKKVTLRLASVICICALILPRLIEFIFFMLI